MFHTSIFPKLVSAIVFLFFLVSTAAGYHPGRFDFIVKCKKSLEIPFYTFNNQIVIPISINDGVPLNFVLDSGTSQAILFDKQLAKDLKVELGRKIRFSGAGSNNLVIAHRSTGVKLALPGISGENMGMVVLNRDYMDMKRFDIHGILGYQIFTRFAVAIDYGRRVLTLMEPQAYHPRGFYEFNLKVEGAKPYIYTEIITGLQESIRVKLLMDTGAAFGLSLITGSHPLLLAPPSLEKVRVGTGLGGEIKGYKSLSRIKIGANAHPEVETVYIHPREYSEKGKLNKSSMGSIGGAFLRDYQVIIDYINQKAYLKPLAAEFLTDNIKP